MKNEIILYQHNQVAKHIEVKLEDEKVWLTQIQMAILFGQTKQNISLHTNNCFKEGELDKTATVKQSLTVQKEGNRKIQRRLEYYNLDVIISVGFRVKSKQGTLFRIWATNVLRDYLLKGYAINQRMDRIENNFENLSKEVNKISLQLKTQDLPNQGIFFDGQIFDAYLFAGDIIKKAKTEIILIANYVVEKVLSLLAKRSTKVTATIYTKTLRKTLSLDLDKHNAQYPAISIKPFANSHYRFLIIDRRGLYNIGASLKDLGKKWFAFSRMDSLCEQVLGKLKMEQI